LVDLAIGNVVGDLGILGVDWSTSLGTVCIYKERERERERELSHMSVSLIHPSNIKKILTLYMFVIDLSQLTLGRLIQGKVPLIIMISVSYSDWGDFWA
jgi:hypothetical protein